MSTPDKDQALMVDLWPLLDSRGLGAYQVPMDEVVYRFILSPHSFDKTRPLRDRIIAFIGAEEGFNATCGDTSALPVIEKWVMRRMGRYHTAEERERGRSKCALVRWIGAMGGYRW